MNEQEKRTTLLWVGVGLATAVIVATRIATFSFSTGSDVNQNSPDDIIYSLPTTVKNNYTEIKDAFKNSLSQTPTAEPVKPEPLSASELAMVRSRLEILMVKKALEEKQVKH